MFFTLLPCLAKFAAVFLKSLPCCRICCRAFPKLLIFPNLQICCHAPEFAIVLSNLLSRFQIHRHVYNLVGIFPNLLSRLQNYCPVSKVALMFFFCGFAVSCLCFCYCRGVCFCGFLVVISDLLLHPDLLMHSLKGHFTLSQIR